MYCDCQVIHQSKGQVPEAVCKLARGTNFHATTSQQSVWQMDQAELNSTNENQTGCLLPLWPTTHTSSRKQKQDLPLPSPGGPLRRTPRSYFLDLEDSTGLFYGLAREYCNGCHWKHSDHSPFKETARRHRRVVVSRAQQLLLVVSDIHSQ